MSLLKHVLLKRLAWQLERGETTLRWIDLYAAQYVADCEHPSADDRVIKLTLLASFLSGQGATHLRLDALPLETSLGFVLPKQSVDDWQARLGQSGAVRSAHESDPQVTAPLVVDGNHVYLARYWRLHEQLEQWMKAQSKQLFQYSDSELDALAIILKKLFIRSELNGADVSAVCHSREGGNPYVTIQSKEVDPRLRGDDRNAPVPFWTAPGSDVEETIDWQSVAVAHTLLQKFTLITGGPGTGKTTTVARILYMLMQRHQLQANKEIQDRPAPVIRLLAPTGKAAVKLAGAIRQHLGDIERQVQEADTHVSQASANVLKLSEHLPETGETIHRFLYQQGALRDQLHQMTRFRSDEVLLGKRDAQRAAVDIVVIDEGSMIDLNLMVELINVLPEGVQLIMLGDHHQLPAVEPGQVFADCVERYRRQPYHPELVRQLSRLTGDTVETFANDRNPNMDHQPVSQPLSHPLCQLRKTYRFDGDLKEAAELIKSGQHQALKQNYRMPGNDDRVNQPDVRWYPFDDLLSSQTVMASIISPYADYFEQLEKHSTLFDLSAAFDRFQILCSTHEGPLGVRYLNQLIENHFGYSAALYHGKAILVTRNHPHLGIFNGDIGFVQAIPNRPGELEICFPHLSNGSGDTQGDVLRIAAGRLREWQPAYAMTVHKSQGSEYQYVCVVLADYAKELLSRELLYTAVTRSKTRCDIRASEAAIDRAVIQSALKQRS